MCQFPSIGGPQFRPKNTIILILRTTPLILGEPHICMRTCMFTPWVRKSTATCGTRICRYPNWLHPKCQPSFAHHCSCGNRRNLKKSKYDNHKPCFIPLPNRSYTTCTIPTAPLCEPSVHLVFHDFPVNSPLLKLMPLLPHSNLSLHPNLKHRHL